MLMIIDQPEDAIYIIWNKSKNGLKIKLKGTKLQN